MTTEHKEADTAAPALADYDKLLADGLTEEAYAQILRKAKSDGDCVTHGFVTDAKKHYGQVRFRTVKYYCHVIAAMVREKRAPREAEEASHLCGNPRCVKVDHMAFDRDGLYNKSRGCCQVFLGVHLTYVCPHEPKCIVFRP